MSDDLAYTVGFLLFIGGVVSAIVVLLGAVRAWYRRRRNPFDC